jgi:tetratricopeptide (TPR) repeat protein
MPASDELRARALDLLVEGDTSSAITDLKTFLEAEPEDGGAWLALGSAYASIDHLPQAAAALARAVEIDPEDVEARLAFARVLVQLGKPDDAAFQLLQASRLEPADPRVLYDLGVVFYDKRLYDKALAWLRKAVAAAPDDARARFALGLIHEAKRDVGAAVASYREAVLKDGTLLDARLTLADALAGMGEHEAAIAELDAVLRQARVQARVRQGDAELVEKAAHNREVLAHALEAMRSQRLLGKGMKELEASALLTEGGFRKKGPVPDDALTVRFMAPLVELYASFDGPDASGALVSAILVLTDPDRAARADDDQFKVTVVGHDGHATPANFATAINLTFLREALGCPMTQASLLYARLLGGEREVEWAGAAARFDDVPRPDKPAERRPGLRVTAR